MKVKEFCLRSFFFSFVMPILAVTIVIGLACRWLNVNYLYGYFVLIIFAAALSNILSRLIDKKYKLACGKCGKTVHNSSIFWQKKNCPCGGRIIIQSK